MGQVSCRKHYLSLRKSLVLYVIAFVVLAVFLSVTTFSICGSAAEGIRASYPPSGEKYYLTNEQGEQLGDGAYIGTVPVPMSKEDERTIALLEKLPIVATPIYSAFCIIAAALLFYRNRLKKPLVELRTASEKIANNDLDFSIDYDNNDELGQLCASFEIMRTTLADNFSKMWRQVEERKALNAAFAHDLRTPLTVILGHLQLLKKENLSAGQTQRIETIYNKAERMKALIQTFYDVSVIDAKEVTPVREDFNLTNLLINLITENAPALEAKGISPVIGLPDHSVYLHSDYGMVERIFQNLIINAIRYSSGSIKIDLKQGKEKSAIFIIENPIDSKVEIDPNRLFERFYTGDKSRHNSGTGVGLAVVKLLTDKLGGNVFAKIENDTLTISLEIK